VDAAGHRYWLQTSAAEGVARAYGAAGDLDRRDAWCAIACGLAKVIGNNEERAPHGERAQRGPQ